jgi:hypothetical protein
MFDNFPKRSATGSHIAHGLKCGLFDRIGHQRFAILGQVEAVRNPSEDPLPLPPFVVGGHRSSFRDYVPFKLGQNGQESKDHPSDGACSVNSFRQGSQVGSGFL